MEPQNHKYYLSASGPYAVCPHTGKVDVEYSYLGCDACHCCIARWGLSIFVCWMNELYLDNTDFCFIEIMRETVTKAL